MSYLQEELVADYNLFASSAIPLDGLSKSQLAGLLTGFFQLRYADSAIRAERRPHFETTLALIDQHRIALMQAGYMEASPAMPAGRAQDDLIRALHRLVVEKGVANPPLRDITETAAFFSTRN